MTPVGNSLCDTRHDTHTVPQHNTTQQHNNTTNDTTQYRKHNTACWCVLRGWLGPICAWYFVDGDPQRDDPHEVEHEAQHAQHGAHRREQRFDLTHTNATN